ncbi:MAG: hypothetical protein SangKO_002520 [Sandaracinaceae bacterium]
MGFRRCFRFRFRIRIRIRIRIRVGLRARSRVRSRCRSRVRSRCRCRSRVRLRLRKPISLAKFAPSRELSPPLNDAGYLQGEWHFVLRHRRCRTRAGE